ncbi:hypothetical protein AYO40_02535 [Planctomycetaceae bacterium SCGC AG-212-D15]|nr:hypothetical protein AYO40_02535 [Planctomycetaceae bacterium SCGC AG-212-D15]
MPAHIQAPKNLEDWLGYDGSADFVAFQPWPGEPHWLWNDGRQCYPTFLFGWIEFSTHPVVARLLASIHPEDWLLLDRRTRRMMPLPEFAARRILLKQWPSLLTGTEWRLLLLTVAGEPRARPTPAADEDALPYWPDAAAEEAARNICESMADELRRQK